MTKMHAQFKISFVADNNLAEVDEDELSDRLTDLLPMLRGLDTLEGAIVLSGSGLPDFEIADEMAPLISGFCFGPIFSLLVDSNETLTHVYTFFNCSSTSVWVARHGRVLILSEDDQEDMPTLRCELAPLLVALYRCGTRYVDFLAQFGPDSRHTGNLAHLRDAAERAREQLVKHGLLADP